MPTLRPIEFFATGADFLSVLTRIKGQNDFLHVHVHVHVPDRLSPDLTINRSASEIPDFMTTLSGVLNRQFYIVHPAAIPTPKVTQHIDGRPRFSLTPQQAPAALVLDERGDCPCHGILSSRVYPVGDDGQLASIYREMLAILRTEYH